MLHNACITSYIALENDNKGMNYACKISLFCSREGLILQTPYIGKNSNTWCCNKPFIAEKIGDNIVQNLHNIV